MSELINKTDNRVTIRWKLLTGASALALASYMAMPDAAFADDTGRSLIWLELGGQFSRLEDNQEIYSPPFLALEPSQFTPASKSLQPPRYGLDTEGAISFQPEDANWIFSASIRYGRSGSKNHVHQQTYPVPYVKYEHFPTFDAYLPVDPLAAKAIDTRSKNSESHAIVDFQVGKDLGLGLFGSSSSSSLSVGIRIAQFRSKSSASLHEDPDWAFHIYNFTYYSGAYRWQVAHQPYHTYAGQFEARRSFHGVGPSLSWKNSVPFAGNTQDGALTLDWGVNASLLFGKQRTRTQHHTSAQYHPLPTGFLFGFRNDDPGLYPFYHHPTNAPAYHSTRSRSVTVPNVGGSVGLSWSTQNFKMSLGYKADFFFGAIDGGIDTAKKENRGFFGPYASISIGLGD